MRSLFILALLIPMRLLAADQGQEAKQILLHAQELSSLSGEGVHPYHLTAVINESSPVGDFEGKFQRDYLNNSEWRSEVQLAEFRQLVIHGPEHVWRAQNIKFTPAIVDMLWSAILGEIHVPDVMGKGW